MQLFYTRSGNGHTVELPNDLENVELSLNQSGQHNIVSVTGTHSGDGRISTTEYQVGVQLGTDQSITTVENGGAEYLTVVDRGDWRGDRRLAIVTLSEVQQ